MTRSLLLALAALLLAIALFPSGAAHVQAASQAVRIAGEDRFATSAAVSQAERPDGSATVFIATGMDFADALAAGPAAASVDAPILLATRDGLPASTAAELERLKPAEIFFVGGTPSLSHAVVEQAFALTTGTLRNAERIAGANRQETAIKLAERFLPGSSEVFLVNGWRYPDALTASSAGANIGVPVLLTSGTQLSPETQTYLGARKPAWTTILGTSASVGDRVYRLARTVTGQNVQRIGGVDRYETNAAVVQKYFGTSGDGIVLATGSNYPDALVASIFSDRGIPVILSGDSCTTSHTQSQVRRLGTDQGEVLRLVGGRVADGAWTVTCPTTSAPPRDCSIRSAVAQSDVPNLSALWVDSASGTELYGRAADSFVSSASTMKVITAVAAYAVLGPDYRIPTYLFHGTKPGSFVVAGMGDPTLMSGYSSVYWNAPSLVSIAAAAKAAGATAVSYDATRFPAPTWNPAWGDISSSQYGSIAPVDALMLDGARYDPNDLYSARTQRPAWDAGVRFAELTGATFDPSIRADRAQGVVGVVYSQPVRTLVSQMLLDSDNMIAEALARLVALESGYDGTYGSVQPATAAALIGLGIDPSGGLSMGDGSGLASSSKVTPRFMDQVLAIIGDGVAPYGELRGMMPSNGVKGGSLTWRLAGIPVGHVDAKIGQIWVVHSLAGFMRLPDGTQERFSIYVWSNSGVSSVQRTALDRIVTAAYNCGSRLSNA